MANRQGASTKSNVPWSVKGIDPEARVVAKEAAKKAGMTLGEWMTSMIQEVGEKPVGDDAPSNHPQQDCEDLQEQEAKAAPIPKDVVTTEQLGFVVESLNRLHERLRTTQDQVRKTEEKSLMAASGLNQAVETVFERLKRVERERQAGAEQDIINRVARLEDSESEKQRIASLKSLELALTQMVHQFEATRQETLTRVSANEDSITTLEGRVDHLDTRITAGFQEVHDALTAISEQLDHTERRAKAVLLEARQASTSTDADFVERTSKKLQLLGSEIKRSGDQITAVEHMVSNLSEKIEAAERRSADGIADVSAELDALREELERAGVETQEAEETAEWKKVARKAEEKVASLQASYDDMLNRVGQDEADVAPQAATTADTVTAEEIESDELDEFDSIFGTDDDFDLDTDPLNDTGSMPEAEPAPAPAPEKAVAPPPKATAADASMLFDDEPSPEKMTAREKIIAAAKARHERQVRAREEAAMPEPQIEDQKPADFYAPPGQNDYYNQQGPVDQDGQNRRLGLPLIILLGIIVLGAIIAGAYFFTRGGDETISMSDLDAASSSSPIETVVETSELAVAPPDGSGLYLEAKAALRSATTDEQRIAAFEKTRQAAFLGYTPAEYMLGKLYHDGTGTSLDLDKAKSWYRMAAEDGNAAAMHGLATLAINANFEGENVEMAVEWFRRAADYGFIDSLYNLGYLYDPSTEGYLPASELSAEESYYWYSLAARQGDPVAPEEMARVGRSLNQQQISRVNQRVANWTPRPYDDSINDRLQLESY